MSIEESKENKAGEGVLVQCMSSCSFSIPLDE